MKGKLCFLLALSLMMIMRWVSATSRPLATTYDLDISHSSSTPSLSASMDSKLSPKQDMKSSIKENRAEKQMNEEEELYTRGMSNIGSSRPSCEHKCYFCTPCEAIEVPTTTSSHSSRVRVQYTNYEPEGWKCKCGRFFYSP